VASPEGALRGRSSYSGQISSGHPCCNFSLSAIQNCPAVWPVSHIAGRISWSAASVRSILGPAMTIASLKIDLNAATRKEVLAAKDVRTLIAHQLGVDVKRVTDEAHFTDDLGADWLDRLELMIEIEAQFPNVEFTDNDVDQMDVVGDLIRHLKSARVPKGDDAAVASREPTIGLSTCSTPLTSRLRRAAEQLARSLVQWQNHFRLGFRH